MTNTTTDGDKSSNYLIIYIVIGVCAGVLVLFLVVLFILWCRRRKHLKVFSSEEVHDEKDDKESFKYSGKSSKLLTAEEFREQEVKKGLQAFERLKKQSQEENNRRSKSEEENKRRNKAEEANNRKSKHKTRHGGTRHLGKVKDEKRKFKDDYKRMHTTERKRHREIEQQEKVKSVQKPSIAIVRNKDRQKKEFQKKPRPPSRESQRAIDLHIDRSHLRGSQTSVIHLEPNKGEGLNVSYQENAGLLSLPLIELKKSSDVVADEPVRKRTTASKQRPSVSFWHPTLDDNGENVNEQSLLSAYPVNEDARKMKKLPKRQKKIIIPKRRDDYMFLSEKTVVTPTVIASADQNPKVPSTDKSSVRLVSGADPRGSGTIESRHELLRHKSQITRESGDPRNISKFKPVFMGGKQID